MVKMDDVVDDGDPSSTHPASEMDHRSCRPLAAGRRCELRVATLPVATMVNHHSSMVSMEGVMASWSMDHHGC